MKNIFIVFLLCIFNVQCATVPIQAKPLIPDEVDELRLLPPEQQVDKIIDMFWDLGGLPHLFYRCASVLTEHPQEVKPILLKYFAEINPPLIDDRANMTYDIINYIIWRVFIIENDLFNANEKKIITKLYEKQPDYYLKTYKQIDNQVLVLDGSIIYLNTGIDVGKISNYKYTLLQKYTIQGYEGLSNYLF
jgi:hypothetical protein